MAQKGVHFVCKISYAAISTCRLRTRMPSPRRQTVANHCARKPHVQCAKNSHHSHWTRPNTRGCKTVLYQQR